MKEIEMMNLAEDVENEHKDDTKTAPKKQGFLNHMMATLEKKYPKFTELLKDLRVQAFLLFLILLIFYLNLIIWDFYFSPDSMGYGLILKNWFEGKTVSNYDLFRPTHPLTTPIAILFTYLMIPLIGPNYLLSFAVLNAIFGSCTVIIFYLLCCKIVGNRTFSVICSLGLAFSFAFWENCEMAEDRSLGFLIMTLYLPLLFAYVGELKSIKWYYALKPWQRGFLTGIFMGLTLVAHVSFVLLFLASLIIIWRYEGLKSYKSIKFIFYLLGTILICGIVFGIVAYLLDVRNIGEFINMFTKYHAGSTGYFAPTSPEGFSIMIQLLELPGGVFTTFFMFISSGPSYKMIIIGLGAVVLSIMFFIMLSARNNKMVRSLYIIMTFWFAHYFFFGPGDRNAWVYLLVPIWLSICIGMSVISNENIKLPIIKRYVPKKLRKYNISMTVMVVIILLINNVVVFSNAHINHDEREQFVHFANKQIDYKNAIILVDESMVFFFGYYSEIESVNLVDVVLNPHTSDYINSSFNNGSAIYTVEYWFRESYIKAGTPRTEQSYESRIKIHKEYIARFNAMYIYQTVYSYDWSDIYQITELNQTR